LNSKMILLLHRNSKNFAKNRRKMGFGLITSKNPFTKL
jgi:hypothetical protein